MGIGLRMGLGLSANSGGAEPSYSFSTAATSSASLQLTTSDASDVTVDWGDGTVETLSSGVTGSHNYSPDYTGDVKVTPASVESEITNFLSFDGAWDFLLSEIPRTVTSFTCRGTNTVSGPLSDLPSGCTVFQCQGSNVVSGNIADIPAGSTYFQCLGSNTVTGDIADLPSGLSFFQCEGSNTISGSLANFPASVTTLRCVGSNTISFTGSDWPNSTMNALSVAGASALSSTVCDAILNALADDVPTWTGSKFVILDGTRTTASDTAVTTLQGLGVAVTLV